MGRKLTKNIKGMTKEQRRAYQRERTASYLERRRQGIPLRRYPRATEIACTKCGVVKPFTTEFFNTRGDGTNMLKRACKVCVSKRICAHIRRTKFGLTEAQLDMLRVRPCVLCGSTKHLRLDHCHRTGKFRNTLCNMCNSALGLFRDNPALLRLAAQYVEHYAAAHVSSSPT